LLDLGIAARISFSSPLEAETQRVILLGTLVFRWKITKDAIFISPKLAKMASPQVGKQFSKTRQVEICHFKKWGDFNPPFPSYSDYPTLLHKIAL
jgi:hypothetical protein